MKLENDRVEQKPLKDGGVGGLWRGRDRVPKVGLWGYAGIAVIIKLRGRTVGLL